MNGHCWQRKAKGIRGYRYELKHKKLGLFTIWMTGFNRGLWELDLWPKGGGDIIKFGSFGNVDHAKRAVINYELGLNPRTGERQKQCI